MAVPLCGGVDLYAQCRSDLGCHFALNTPTESCRCTIRIQWYHQNPLYTQRILVVPTDSATKNLDFTSRHPSWHTCVSWCPIPKIDLKSGRLGQARFIPLNNMFIIVTSPGVSMQRDYRDLWIRRRGKPHRSGVVIYPISIARIIQSDKLLIGWTSWCVLSHVQDGIEGYVYSCGMLLIIHVITSTVPYLKFDDY